MTSKEQSSNIKQKKSMASKIRRFFGIIPQNGHFIIPKSFIGKYGDVIPNPIHLKTPDGREWNIKWIKLQGNFWFQKVWRDFKTYYSLAYGHLLLFEYNIETKNFAVCIFDMSTLEIQYPVQAGNDHEQNNSPKNNKKMSEKPPLSSLQPQKKLKTEEKQDKSKNPSFTMVMKSTYLNQYMHVIKAFAKEYLKEEKRSVILQLLDGRSWPCKYHQGRIIDGWKKFVSHNKLKVGDTCVFELIDDSQNLTFKVDIKPFVDIETHSPPPQGKEEFQRKPRMNISLSLKTEAKDFDSENPFFMFKIQPSNRPRVPICFNREHFEKKAQVVMLKVGNKIWEVQLLCENPSSKASSRLSKGWAKFVNDHKLERGDECVFELITKKPIALFDVHIFRCPS